MKGHDRYLKLRRSGKKPSAVFVTDLPYCPESTDVHVDPDDTPEALDLRFMVGMVVHLSVEDTPKGRRLSQACADASKRCITAFHRPGERLAHHITDTEKGEWKF